MISVVESLQKIKEHCWEIASKLYDTEKQDYYVYLVVFRANV